MFVTRSQLLAFRTRRQYLALDAQGRTPEDVFTILRELQPFPPIAGSMPGSAPHPRSRIVDYKDEWSQQWRAAGRLVKGRFMNGNVAYVTNVDFALYAAAFRRPLSEPLPRPALRILDLLEQDGPLPKFILRELSKLERGSFERTLMSLNRAFEVMEIQREVDWESPWDLRQRAYPSVNLDACEQADTQAEVLCCFTKAFGPASVSEISDWSGWSQRTIRNLLDNLLTRRDVIRIEVEGQTDSAYLASDEIDMLSAVKPVNTFLTVLPSNDPFVLPQWSCFKKQYQPYRLPYCYGVIVLDGEIAGAAWGRYKRRYIHIEELNLNPSIVHDSPQMNKVLAALESHVSDGWVPIHIYGINGEAEATWVREILERNGFVWNAGYYLKEATQPKSLVLSANSAT